MPKCIGYARVSTQDQSLDLQIDALNKQGCSHIYVEKISGVKKLKERKELTKALARAGEGDTLAVWKIDRLSRNLSELLKIKETLDRRGIKLRVVGGGGGGEGAEGELLFNMIGIVAQWERSLIVERTKAGLEAARQRGAVLGRPRALVGDRAAKAHDLTTRGRSVDQIAAEVGVHASTIYRWRKANFSGKNPA